MSVYTPVSAEQLSAWLKAYAVGDLVDFQGVEGGVENSNYFVTTTGEHYVLTLFERLAPDALRFYLPLMAHLAHEGIPCPAPLADRQGHYLGALNGKPAALVTRLPGVSVDTPDVQHCARVGALLASLHQAARGFANPLPHPRGPRWWREAAASVLPMLEPDDARLLRDELRFQSLHRFEDAPRGVIHADLFRDNVLFDGARLSGVLDFYFAGSDVLLFDLAVAANDWCIEVDGHLDPARTRALLAAYHALRPLTPLERGAWPVMLRAAALRFWLSRLQDFHLPRPGALVLVKDPAHFRALLARRAAVATAPWTE